MTSAHEQAAPGKPYEKEISASFSAYLLTQPAIQDAAPETTDIFFDLDETMFRRNRFGYGEVDDTTLVGRWRADMPETLAALRQRGFGIHILSSASLGYIRSALAIYAQQFSQDPAESFSNILSSRDISYYNDKTEACWMVADQVGELGRHAIFVDDAALSFEEDEEEIPFDYIRVPRELMYRDDDNPEQYRAAFGA